MILANRLVGNPDNAAGLEMLLRGPILRFPHGARVALSGADMGACLNGARVARGRVVEIPPGGTLELATAANGVRAYLAVAGGIQTPIVLGSRSTFLPGGFGGWRGRALKAGDILTLGEAGALRNGSVSETGWDGVLRVLPGPQLAGFADPALKALTSGEFVLSADANRLGLRLVSQPLHYRAGEIASQAVLPGAIQVPPDGLPIILGWDGPVTGGYPVIAGIISADWHHLAQLRPGGGLRFRFVGIEEAQAAWAEHRGRLNGAIAWDD
jgi:biotin-dependent carboxylase-like uncharacterized protein